MRALELFPDHLNQGDFNGVTVRKGTVGAFIMNAKALAAPSITPEARAEAERDIIEALPALRAVGLFDVLEVRDELLRAFVDAN